MKYISDEHLAELQTSAIAEDIADLNFRSFDGIDETELDEIFTLLIQEPDHNNNGTLCGKSQNELAATLRSGGWVFQGWKGISIKPNRPRKNNEGKIIKYESPRGKGNQQIFIPKISVRAGLAIASKLGEEIHKEYAQRIHLLAPNVEDPDFWNWYLEHEGFIVITEGAKKASSLVSNGYPAIALNGVWGWGTNIKDMFGEVEKNDRGKSLKTIHPDLEMFLDGRELILAFDRDENSDTMKYVEAAKTAFIHAMGDEGTKITQLSWRTKKGVDDYLAAKGIKVFDRLYQNRKEVKTPKTYQDKEQRVTCSDTLLEIAQTATYFHTPDKIAYADVRIRGIRHTYKVRSSAFKLWLSGEYFKETGKGASAQPLQDVLNTLEAIAIHDGETQDVHLRTAKHQDKIYLDLGTSDWQAIEVDATGWRIVNEPPIRFWRPDSLLPLPIPESGGSLDQLQNLLNVDRSSWIAIATFLLFSFCPNSSYPVLVLNAQRGSGKSTTAEIIKSLIDPGKAPLIGLPTNDRDAGVTASRRWLMVYDNVSHISNDESDRICKLATGFGLSTRKLHTDDEETIFEAARPQVITAIDGIVTRDDLADRVLMTTLEPISPENRLPQSELKQKIYDSRPQIMGALLTALSQTLSQLPHTLTSELPRMADYALFSIASEKALGLEDGDFLTTFNESRDRVKEVVIESSPVGEAIIKLVDSVEVPTLGWVIKGNESRAEVWKGTASELLKKLEDHTDEATYRSRFFPKAANRLKAQLNRLAPDLRLMGIEVMESKTNGTKNIVLEKVVKVSTPSTPKDLKPIQETKKEGVDTLKSIDTQSTPTQSIDTQSTPTQSIDTHPKYRHPIDTLIDTQKTHTEQHFQAEGVDGVDKKPTFSGNDRSKLNSFELGSENVLSSESNVENHNFSTSPKLGDRVRYVGGMAKYRGWVGEIVKTHTQTHTHRAQIEWDNRKPTELIPFEELEVIV